MDEDGNVLEISPFLPGMEFVRPMDMEVGPDGALYIAEWGDAFWGSNEDAQVVRIEYRTDNAMGAGMSEIAQDAPAVHIYSPEPGSFFNFGEAQPFTVSVSNIGEGPLMSESLEVTTYSGFDTHKLPVETQQGGAGMFSVSKAFTHMPDIHMLRRGCLSQPIQKSGP